MIHAREDYNRIQDPDGLIPEDEPVFLMRASDCVAADTVADWACRASCAGAEPEMVLMALQHAMRMKEWQRNFGKQIPDLPADKDNEPS